MNSMAFLSPVLYALKVGFFLFVTHPIRRAGEKIDSERDQVYKATLAPLQCRFYGIGRGDQIADMKPHTVNGDGGAASAM
jgi:hypothetical protein